MYNDQIDRYFLDQAMGIFLASGSSRSGYVFTNLDLGTKSFNVDLIGDDNMVKTFTFFISVPGLRADHQDVDFDNLYSAAEVVHYDEVNFKDALKNHGVIWPAIPILQTVCVLCLYFLKNLHHSIILSFLNGIGRRAIKI